jgi:hypothetical protein
LRNIRHFLVKYASVFSFFGYRYSRLHSWSVIIHNHN